MKRYFFFLAAVAVLAACKKDRKKEPAYRYSVSPVVRPEGANTVMLGATLELTVYHQVNGGCGQFDRFTEENKGEDTTLITVQARYPVDAICTDDLPVRQTPYRFTPRKRGTHYLQFRSYVHENRYVTDTIEVK